MKQQLSSSYNRAAKALIAWEAGCYAWERELQSEMRENHAKCVRVEISAWSLLRTVLPGAYLLVANNTAADFSHAPCYLDLEYQYPYSYVCRFCGLYILIHTLWPEVVPCSITFWWQSSGAHNPSYGLLRSCRFYVHSTAPCSAHALAQAWSYS